MISATTFLRRHRATILAYGAALSGSAGRLVFSLAYFVLLANTLAIADFGRFAAASAAGVMLSRILAFGFTSPLYRIATVKPQLIGTYTAGVIAFAVASLPVLAGAALLTHAVFFAGDTAWTPFALIVAAEALLWRPTEIVAIVNNGMGRFARAARLTILGTALRAAAAGLLVLSPWRDLTAWAVLYLGANALALAFAVIVDYPRQRLRLAPRLYGRRLRDAGFVSLSEILFYLQAELDKLLVLALGGAERAGAYAVIMRLVDLTAIPIRAFSMMYVQKIMRTPGAASGARRLAAIEIAIFAVSTAGLAALAGLLWLFPTILGHSVAGVAGLIGLAFAVPGLRNLVEYQAELLYGRGQTGLRALMLALLAALKGVLLAALLGRSSDVAALVFGLNGAFLALYLASAAFTYAALQRDSRAL